jgi:K+-transporting ATPase ATPase C chain
MSADEFRKANPEFTGNIPADMLTRARGASVDQLKQLIAENTEPADLGFLGEPRVNVLMLNIALDQRFPVSK